MRPRTGIVFYDGECAFCRALPRWLGGVLRRQGFALQTLQSASREPRVSRALGLSPATGFDSMWVLPAAGPPLPGVDGMIHLARRVWWARPLVWLSHAPLGLSALRAGYRWVARHRSCAGGVCRVRDTAQPPYHDSTLRRLRWAPLPLLVTVPLTTGALAAGNLLEPWVSMWTIAIALFFGFKVLTWSRARTASVSLRRSLAYFLAWVGMDAEEFLSGEPLPFKPATAEWRQGWLHVVAGLGLLSLAVPRLVTVSAVLASWVGLAGLILVLHFGLFHLLALGWQVLGVPARPIMQKPLAARSLGEFWGRRWNSGFRQLSHDFVFKPLVRRIGPTGATLAAFSASGLIHELVISAPASGGYGLPTTYFLLQGLAVVAERSGLGANLGLGRGVGGRTFTWLVAGIPVYALFHPAFIEQVAIPMFRALGVWQ